MARPLAEAPKDATGHRGSAGHTAEEVPGEVTEATELAGLRSEAAAREAALVEAANRADEIAARLQAAVTERERAQQDAAERGSAMEGLGRTVAALRREAAAREAALVEAAKRADEIAGQLQAATTERERAQRDAAARGSALEALGRTVATLRSALAAREAALLEVAKRGDERPAAALRARLDRAEGSVAELDGIVDASHGAIDTLRGKLADAQAENSRIVTTRDVLAVELFRLVRGERPPEGAIASADLGNPEPGGNAAAGIDAASNRRSRPWASLARICRQVLSGGRHSNG